MKQVERTNSRIKGPIQVNQNYIKKFYARCNLIKARLYTALEDESEALLSIQNALDHLQERDEPTRVQRTIRQKSDYSLQSQMSSASGLTAVSTRRSDEVAAPESQMIQTLINLKN